MTIRQLIVLVLVGAGGAVAGGFLMVSIQQDVSLRCIAPVAHYDAPANQPYLPEHGNPRY